MSAMEPQTEEEQQAQLDDPDQGPGYTVTLWFREYPNFHCAYVLADGKRCQYSTLSQPDADLHVWHQHRKPKLPPPPPVPAVPLFGADGRLIGTGATEEEEDDGN